MIWGLARDHKPTPRSVDSCYPPVAIRHRGSDATTTLLPLLGVPTLLAGAALAIAALLLSTARAWSAEDALLAERASFDAGISGNPGATNIIVGNGMLGRLL